MNKKRRSYSGLDFSFADTLSELVNLGKLAKKFIEPNSRHVLDSFGQTLSNFRASPGNGNLRWEVTEDKPICTCVSKAEYEVGNRKGTNVFGTLSCVWEISTDGQRRNNTTYILKGKASTKIRIFEVAKDHCIEVARWRFEVGTHDSPGCHFHTQILGDSGDQVFPHRLPVPRLPSISITPLDALDFLLGELFQDRWYQTVGQSTTPEVKVWSRNQRKRLINLLQWQLEQVRGGDASPWLALKYAKPEEPSMLLSKVNK